MVAARLGAAGLVGLVIGTATSFAQAWLGGTWQALANSASPWLLGAFVAGAIQLRCGRAVLAGLGCCVLEVVGYYALTSARGFAVSQTEIVFWAVCAVLGGPVFGWAGWGWRRASGSVRAVGAAFLPGTFLAEAIGTYQLRLHYHADAVLFAVIGLILLAVVVTPTRAVGRTLAATVAVTLAGIAVYWLGLAAAAGSAFGA
jgi:hypothetical protein